jgi:hypothetical protein
MIRNPAVTVLLLAASISACSKSNQSKNTETPKPATPATDAAATPARPVAPPAPGPVAQRGVKTEMRNVKFHLTDRAVADLRILSGEIWPTGKNEMPDFDDKTSFEIRVANGKVSISPQALADILNSHVFGKSDSPLKNLAISIDKNRLIIKGRLHTKGDIPFETGGSLSVTPDGRIRVITEEVKALHVPVKGVMGLFGIELAKIINTSKIDGMDTDKNDLLMNLATLLPPPHIQGKLTTVSLEPHAIVTYFGDGGASAASSSSQKATSYMAFEGNPIRFGKLTMASADLVIFDLDPNDPLDWNQDHYRDQLVAGYSKITPAFGLRSYVKDYAKLPGAATALANPPPEAPAAGPVTAKN